MRVNTRRAGDIGSDLCARNADPLIDPKDSLFDLDDSAVHGTSDSMSSSTRGWAGDLEGCKTQMQRLVVPDPDGTRMSSVVSSANLRTQNQPKSVCAAVRSS